MGATATRCALCAIEVHIEFRRNQMAVDGVRMFHVCVSICSECVASGVSKIVAGIITTD